MDKELGKYLAPYRGSKFFVFHSAFGYLAKDYGLEQVAVETGGGSPGPKHIKNLIDSAKAEEVKVIFVQKTFPKIAAEKIAEKIGGAVVALDPLCGDYIENMKLIAKELDAAMAKQKAASDGEK